MSHPSVSSGINMNSGRTLSVINKLLVLCMCVGLVFVSQSSESFSQTKTKVEKKSTKEKEEKTTKRKSRRTDRSVTREDSTLLSVFKPLAISASESTVGVLSGRRQIAVGTVVGSDGLIMTKASEMRGTIKCKLADGEILPAEVIGIDTENDLALLKIDGRACRRTTHRRRGAATRLVACHAY